MLMTAVIINYHALDSKPKRHRHTNHQDSSPPCRRDSASKARSTGSRHLEHIRQRDAHLGRIIPQVLHILHIRCLINRLLQGSEVGARQARLICEVNDHGAVAEESSDPLLERCVGVGEARLERCRVHSPVLAGKVADLACLGPVGLAGRHLAADVWVKMGEGASAVAVRGDWVDVKMVGWRQACQIWLIKCLNRIMLTERSALCGQVFDVDGKLHTVFTCRNGGDRAFGLALHRRKQGDVGGAHGIVGHLVGIAELAGDSLTLRDGK